MSVGKSRVTQRNINFGRGDTSEPELVNHYLQEEGPYTRETSSYSLEVPQYVTAVRHDQAQSKSAVRYLRFVSAIDTSLAFLPVLQIGDPFWHS